MSQEFCNFCNRYGDICLGKKFAQERFNESEAPHVGTIIYKTKEVFGNCPQEADWLPSVEKPVSRKRIKKETSELVILPKPRQQKTIGLRKWEYKEDFKRLQGIEDGPESSAFEDVLKLRDTFPQDIRTLKPDHIDRWEELKAGAKDILMHYFPDNKDARRKIAANAAYYVITYGIYGEKSTLRRKMKPINYQNEYEDFESDEEFSAANLYEDED